jgi:hypothetical protein
MSTAAECREVNGVKRKQNQEQKTVAGRRSRSPNVSGFDADGCAPRLNKKNINMTSGV